MSEQTPIEVGPLWKEMGMRKRYAASSLNVGEDVPNTYGVYAWNRRDRQDERAYVGKERRRISGSVARQWSLIIVLAGASALAAGVLGTKPETAGAYVVAGEIPQRPPVVVLRSKSPRQGGVWGSFCVSMPPDKDGGIVSLCADYADDPEPRWLSVVRPGERIVIWLRKTQSASGGVSVYANGCENQSGHRRSFRIRGQKTTWVVPRWFGSKRFELSLWFGFETVDGRLGSTAASLGILVSRTRDRALVRNRRSLDCGEPY